MFYINSISQVCLRFIWGYNVEGKNIVKIVWVSVQLLNKLFVTSSHFQEYKSMKCESNWGLYWDGMGDREGELEYERQRADRSGPQGSLFVSRSSSSLKRRKPVEETFERVQSLITLSCLRFFLFSLCWLKFEWVRKMNTDNKSCLHNSESVSLKFNYQQNCMCCKNLPCLLIGIKFSVLFPIWFSCQWLSSLV